MTGCESLSRRNGERARGPAAVSEICDMSLEADVAKAYFTRKLGYTELATPDTRMMHALAHGTPVYRTGEMRAHRSRARPPRRTPPPLMERAGLAAAELARELAGGTRQAGARARRSRQQRRRCVRRRAPSQAVVVQGHRRLHRRRSEALRRRRSRARAHGRGRRRRRHRRCPRRAPCGLVVDGLFGIGLAARADGPLRGAGSRAINGPGRAGARARCSERARIRHRPRAGVRGARDHTRSRSSRSSPDCSRSTARTIAGAPPARRSISMRAPLLDPAGHVIGA